jgi:serine/threonine protein kinase
VIRLPSAVSPEQVRGERRSTGRHLAAGCVLYEILTGARAFPAQTALDAMASVLQQEPDWEALPATTPYAVRRLLRRCLDKNTRARLRDMGDARADLNDGPPDEPSLVKRATRPGLPVFWATAAIAAAVLGIVAGRG